VDTPVIIEVALNGGTPRRASPRVPKTVDELVADGIACIDAGAAIVHQHNDEPVLGGPGGHAAAPYATVWRRIRERHPQAIFYPTMAGGGHDIPIERRYAHIEALAETGLLDMGLVDPGTTNIGRFDADGSPRAESIVYQNTYADAVYMVETCRRLGLGLSVSIFEPGFVRFIAGYLRAGTLPPGGFVKFYFGGARAGFGLPPTPVALEAYLEMLVTWQLPWLVSIQGGDLVAAEPFARYVIERGGHLQVGLEPNPDPERSNVELVAAAVDLCKRLGRRCATSAQARAIIGLPQAARTETVAARPAMR
jgi:3-keto-5-aminohexanoate cleavage enzyme